MSTSRSFLRALGLLVGLTVLLAIPGLGQAQIAFRAAASAGIASTGDITFVGSGGAATTTTCGSIAPTIPGGSAGDFLLAHVVAREEAAVVTMPGWNTLMSNNPPTQTNYQVVLFWRIATGGDPNTITQAGTCDSLFARISRFSGVDTTDPVLNATASTQLPAANWSLQNQAYIRTGSETTTAPNMMLVLAAMTRDDSDVAAPPAGCAGATAFTTLNNAYVSRNTAGRDSSLWLYYQLQTTAGVKGPYCQGKTVGSDANHGIVFALRPSGLRINVPVGTAAGDLMVASIAVQPSTLVITAPAGWTLLRDNAQAAGSSSRMATYYRVATAGEPASYLWTFSGGASTGATGGIISFSGVDNTTPIDVEFGNTTPSGLTHTATGPGPAFNGITTTVANTMLVGSFEFTSTPIAANWTSNMTASPVNQGSIAGPSNAGIRLLMAYEARAATGATGTRTATASGVTADTGLAYLLALRPAISAINHFSISHAGSGVACVDQTITITAHDASHNPVNANSLTVALSTTNTKGSWTGIVAGGGTLSDPTPGDGAASYTFAAGSNSVQLSFRYANLATTSETFGFNVSGGGFSETTGTATAADDPSFTMAQAGFQFRNVTDSNTTIPTQLSGKPSDTGFNAKTIRVQAIRTDTVTGSCTGLFASQARTVDLGAECNNPATCAARQVSINGASIATSNDNGGAGASAYTGVSLTFNASSEADTVIAYPDAGLISVHARYDLDPLVAGFEMIGSSNSFVVRPFGLTFPGVAHSNTAAGALIGAAGDNFSMTVTAYQWAAGEDANGDGIPDAGVNISDNGTVPNFAATATVTSNGNLPGVAPGTVSRGATCATTPATLALSGGTGTAADWCYSEAGNVLLKADVTNYIAAGINITGGSDLDGGGLGGYVGRFRPKQFVVSAGSRTNRAALSCAPASSFTYMSERLDLSFTLTAQNTQGGTTRNYHGAYAKLVLGTPANFNLGARSGATVFLDPGVTPVNRVDATASSGTWGNGVAGQEGTANVTVQSGILRKTSGSAVDGPFTAVNFGIAPNDGEGVTMNVLDLDTDTTAGNDKKNVGVSTEVRFGRLRLQNASGPQNIDLPIPIQTEYWNGTVFTVNGIDSCTSLSAANLSLGSYSGGITGVNMGNSHISPGGAFGSGVGSLKLTKASPPATTPGAATVTVDLVAEGKAYLQGAWGGATYTFNPSARATWGLYGSQPQNFIFQRENY